MHRKGINNNISSISYVDLVIYCRFGENYAKQFTKFLNDTFSYHEYSCYTKGSNTFVKLLATDDVKIFNVNFIFAKNELSKTINLEITSDILPKMLTYTYDSFSTFLNIINDIQNEEEFKKIFIQQS